MDEAQSFDVVDAAIRAVNQQKLAAVDLVYVFSETRGPLDIVFRLRD